MFAVWHFAPLSSNTPGGDYAFVFYSLLLGLSYGWYSFQTGSILRGTVSHCLHDTLGLSWLVYRKWLGR